MSILLRLISNNDEIFFIKGHELFKFENLK